MSIARIRRVYLYELRVGINETVRYVRVSIERGFTVFRS